jgi:cyanate permease
VLTPATQYYGCSASTVNLLTALGALVFIPMVPVYNFAVDRFGLRVSMLASVFIVFVGSAVRLLSNGTGDVLSPRGFVWVILGIVINAMPGPFSGGAAPKFSAVWFRVNERATSTGQ